MRGLGDCAGLPKLDQELHEQVIDALVMSGRTDVAWALESLVSSLLAGSSFEPPAASGTSRARAGRLQGRTPSS